ncbi:MAG: nicotinamide mononucleotide transporter [Bacteroidia bacterium]|nr:nicotinamide mononucleotide transporter [Bacteroidia bacterium]
MEIQDWILDNYIEIFGAVTGIIFVFLEIRQSIWLWPVGIITSAVYIWVFFTGKLYADMGLQGYYLIISLIGWYWWVKGAGGEKEIEAKRRFRDSGRGRSKRSGDSATAEEEELEKRRLGEPDVHNGLPSLEGLGVGIVKSTYLEVSRIKLKVLIILTGVFILLHISMWKLLDNFTDSPVPGWDSFITSLSIIATWMLARKIIEHWYLWMIVNGVAVILFLSRGLYPTVVLYVVYFTLSFIGLKEWKKTLSDNE